MTLPDFPIELKTDSLEADRDLFVLIEDRLGKLRKGHTDLTGAAARIEQPAQGRETPYVYEASIVVYARPNNISATEKREDPQMALKVALDAIERQVRKQREKLKDDRDSGNNL